MITRRENRINFLHFKHMPKCNATVDKIFDGYCSFQFMESGAIDLYYGEQTYRLTGSHFWFCWPGPHIHFHSADGKPWNHRYIAFSGPLVEAWQEERLIRETPITCPSDQCASFAKRFDEILAYLSQTGQWAQRTAINLLENLLMKITESGAQQEISGTLQGKVATTLEANSFNHPDYNKLAREMGMGTSTLRRKFREETGMALHQYVQDLKIREAKRMLYETNQSLQEIADRLGYNDVYYFNRHFAQKAGMPPGTYRKSRFQEIDKSIVKS